MGIQSEGWHPSNDCDVHYTRQRSSHNFEPPAAVHFFFMQEKSPNKIVLENLKNNNNKTDYQMQNTDNWFLMARQPWLS